MKTKIVYIANDGKEFDNQEMCKEWEKASALRDTLAKIHKNWPPGVLGGNVNWAKHITFELLKDFHIVKREQTSNQSDDNRP